MSDRAETSINLGESAPMNTAINEPEPILDIFCPFRKKTCFYDDFLSVGAEERGEPPKRIITNIGKATYSEEEFLPCLREKCSAYGYVYPHCNLIRIKD